MEYLEMRGLCGREKIRHVLRRKVLRLSYNPLHRRMRRFDYADRQLHGSYGSV